jgi:hypothetical protein
MMPLSAKKTAKPSSRETVFAEELRLPLTNKSRDAFLRAMESDTTPNAAAKAAVRRYKRSRSAKKA